MEIFLLCLLFLNACWGVKIASLQISNVGLSPKERLAKSIQFIEKVAENGTNFVVMPKDWIEFSESLVQEYQEIAKNNRIAISYTFVKGDSSRFVGVIDYLGNLVLEYSKPIRNQTIPQPSVSFEVTDVKLDHGVEVGVGVLFSDDIYFPESTRVLMLKGAELVVVSASEGIADFYVTQLKSRAHENVNSVIVANSPNSERSNGKSMYVDWLVNTESLGGKEGVLKIDFDVEALRKWRTTEAIHGDVFRRPYTYKSLCFEDFKPTKVKVEDDDDHQEDDLKIKIALAQITPGDSVVENQDLISKYVRRATTEEPDVDLVVIPEMFSSGYFKLLPEAATSYDILKFSQDVPVDPAGEFVRFFQALASELDVAIALTFLKKVADHPPMNTIAVIDRHGDVLYEYDKVHTCPFLLEINNTPGRSFHAKVWNTRNGDVVIGSMICFDRSQVEPTRLLMQKGVELIISTNGCELSEMNLLQLGVRAHENAIAIALTNYPISPPAEAELEEEESRRNRNRRSNPPFNGLSTIVDHTGGLVTRSGEGEGIEYGVINVSELRRYRNSAIGEVLTNPKLHPELCELRRCSKFAGRENFYDRVAGSTT